MKGFEPNYLRKTYRVTLPAKVVIEEKEFKTTDWSFEGFGIEKTPQDRFEREKDYLVTFIVPFAGFSISFNARAKLAWQSDNRAGFEFIRLPEEAKLVLREYIEAYIEGRLKDVEGIVSATNIQTVPPYLDQPLTEEEKKALDRKFKIRAVLYTLLFLLLLGAFYLVVVYSPVVYSVEAFYSGRMVNVISPAKGVLKKIKVKENQKVAKGQILAVIERIDFSKKEERVPSLDKVTREIATLEAQREKLRAEIDKGVLKIRKLREELRYLEGKLKAYQEAYKKGYIGKKLYDDLKAKHRAISADIELLKKDVMEKEKLLGLLNRKIAILRTSLRLPRNTASKDYGTLEVLEDGQSIVLKSPASGFVLSIYKKEGEIVRSGEPIMSIEDESSKGHVIGRFKKKDAVFINVGDEAVVYFPSLGTSVKGYVSAIGKFGLYDESIVSESEEYALRDVPVKVILETAPGGAHQGMKAEISIRTESYKPYIFQLIERWINES